MQELVPFYDIENDAFDVEMANACIDTYNALVRRVEELNLIPAIDAKPIIDVCAPYYRLLTLFSSIS